MAASLDGSQEERIEDAVCRFVEMRARGEAPEVREFAKGYPGLEREIVESIQAMEKIDSLFDSVVRADASDFEDAGPDGDLVGHRIGSFEITEMIGRGGMGVVYLARDTKLKRPVAIKSMPPELAGDTTTRTRFRREAELLASLNHPNIAVIYDIIEEDGEAGYLILEYVPGETLAERIAREPLTLEQALRIARQIAEAVSAAHKKGVVHRDLKPGNIKITPDDAVKVLDFGLAKAPVHEDKTDEITATEPGRIVGTPAYMSPEQARGKDTDGRTDIWSFGCIMFQMLTGRLPFEGETATDVLAKIIEREPDWERLPQSIPTDIRDLLRRCLAKDPDQRLAHIADATAEIDEILSGRAPAASVSLKLRTAAAAIVLAILVILSVVIVRFAFNRPVQPASKQIRLVVLPFENLGPTEDEYFADGITDAITARLAGIHGLGVISRQSAMQYKNADKGTQQIAQELRVDYILEGTVQRERPADPNSNVRIIPQLIRASDDTHVWAQPYDNDMSEIFRIQADVAERVAQELEITLLESERQALASRSTENMEAYNYYLRGNVYGRRSVTEHDTRIAVQMYEEAIRLDPTFALAYCKLSHSHLRAFWYAHDRSEERLAMAKRAVDKALQLSPDLPEAHFALGHYYYHGHLDYERALDQFAIARKSQPANSDLLSFIGFVQRRQGRFEQGLVNIRKACELDPLSSLLVRAVGETFLLLRNYPEAERYLERAVSLAPDAPGTYHLLNRLYLSWEGSTEKARAALQRGLGNGAPTDDPGILEHLVLLDVYDRNYQGALDRLSLRPHDFDMIFEFIPSALRWARIYGHMNNHELVKKHCEEARAILESRIQEGLEDARVHSSLGIAYAGLGLKEEAIREGTLAVELLPVTKEAIGGVFRVRDLAVIYTKIGEFDAAIDQIEYLLSVPSDMSVPRLRLDPTWDPLRGHPRFQKLVEADR
jgi:TolB-like protein